MADAVAGGGNCSSPGKHPRTGNGLLSATTDLDQIARWWDDYPNANIGLVTGKISGVFVLDVDGETGIASMAALAERYEPLPPTRTIRTGGGRHYYFRHPGVKIRTVARFCSDLPGLDSRGDGGYVVAPPSLHISGRRYEMDCQSPDAIADAPVWLVDAINKRVDRVATRQHEANGDAISEGARNSGLFRLGASLRGRGMQDDELLRTLLAENLAQCDPPLEYAEVFSIAQSVSKYPIGSNDQALCALSDVGNAQRFATQHAGSLIYVPERERWMEWCGVRWEADMSGRVTELAKQVAAGIQDEAKVAANHDLSKAIVRHAKATNHVSRIKAMIELAKSTPSVVVPSSQLDQAPTLLAVRNGTVDLETCALKPGDPLDRITMLANVAYDESAKCPAFNTFLERVAGGDDELAGYLQRVVGYAISGFTSEQCLFFLYGPGANGKSTLLNVLGDVLGEGYCRVTPAETIMARPGAGPANVELARLPRARVVVTNEIEEGAWLAESLVKQITGGDKLVARQLYKDYFEFKPQFKLFVAGNHKPVIRSDDHGIWRRIHLVPFLTTIPMEDRDPKLAEKLCKEGPGILNWAVAGFASWRQLGLAPPRAVTEAVDEYKQEMDLFGQWLEDCCILRGNAETRAARAYEVYRFWAIRNGYRPMTNASFGRKVKERFHAPRTSRGIHYIGFAVRAELDAVVMSLSPQL